MRFRATPRAVLVSLTAVTLGVVLVAQQGPARQGGAPDRGRGTTIQAGQECPPGTTLDRVNTFQAPEFPPPTIVDYRPQYKPVVEQHPVPNAKFPVVDIHSHTGPTAETIDRLIAE